MALRRKYMREGNLNLLTPMYHSFSIRLFELTFALKRKLYFSISLKPSIHCHLTR